MNLMKENDQIRAEVIESLSGLNDEHLNQKLKSETWSIAQVLVHLYLLEKGLSKWIPNVLSKGEEQIVGEKPIHVVPDRSTKFKAPANFEPRDEFYTLDSVLSKLDQSRKALKATIDGVSEEELKKRALPHPVLGPINLKQWVEIIGLHEKRHLEQIHEIKQALFVK